MKNGPQKILSLAAAAGLILWMAPAQANLKELKAYQEAYPDTKPKCINCHEEALPKKDEGLHEWNNYGKAARALNPKPDADTFLKLGTFESFSKNAKPAADEKK